VMNLEMSGAIPGFVPPMVEVLEFHWAGLHL
jgi:hypothetical protein